MRRRGYLKLASLLAAGGVVFAGYLSGVKLTSGMCAFSEPCPMFLGHPACYTGFLLFVATFVLSLFAVSRPTSAARIVATAGMATVGVIFAGWLSLGEWLAARAVPLYGMGLPTCAYGFVFFLAVAVLALVAWRKHL